MSFNSTTRPSKVTNNGACSSTNTEPKNKGKLRSREVNNETENHNNTKKDKIFKIFCTALVGSFALGSSSTIQLAIKGEIQAVFISLAITFLFSAIIWRKVS